MVRVDGFRIDALALPAAAVIEFGDVGSDSQFTKIARVLVTVTPFVCNHLSCSSTIQFARSLSCVPWARKVLGLDPRRVMSLPLAPDARVAFYSIQVLCGTDA
jgi:hypothetical protein